ncbi:fumarylacetoacetate hydrolase family protein [Methyloterrigena soli]|uniref:Fumarylacetoacetate hydrolase family protein n=2 Tax=Paradevosia shaoguanensis TaxID=1335043 RepID=A0AA41QIY7_9HYPH|nr:fumarylacetoacetate hydrolase family protein [Paradevosia shaoguanensis]MCF1740834.1 fumarylacetoacetate hydrolase family protein [Paradevosia shaoguanensis]MCI0125318.1 fumarylacetoacetate hydrolase family protein [Paradevosia shaoguanensis]
MTQFVIPAPPVAAVPVAGGGAFPVRRIYCVGRNYAEHAREMGHDPDREPPFFFGKPADSLVTSGADTPYPASTQDFQFEVELVVALAEGGSNLSPEAIPAKIFGYAVGIDMTQRDVQSVAKKAGRPWDMSKGFDHSAPIGDLIPATRIGHPSRGVITLKVNGVEKQCGDISDLIWPIADAVAYLSNWVELKPGDLIFTGTPAGVGPVVRGDLLEGAVEGVGSVTTRIA